MTEDAIYRCFAAAQPGSPESFVDVEEYENAVMYPEFARWAREAGYPDISQLFLKVAGEEKAHSVWLRNLYRDMGTPPRGEDTARAIAALDEIKANFDGYLAQGAKQMVEKALTVAVRVENREYQEIYPRFRDRAVLEGNLEAARVYERVIESERQHAGWFQDALARLQAA